MRQWVKNESNFFAAMQLIKVRIYRHAISGLTDCPSSTVIREEKFLKEGVGGTNFASKAEHCSSVFLNCFGLIKLKKERLQLNVYIFVIKN